MPSSAVLWSPGLAALGRLPSLAMDINQAKGIALIFFFGFFLILLLRLLLGSKASFSKRAEIPLHDYQVVEPREQTRHE